MTRTEIINTIAKRNAYQTYLEIGLQNSEQNFDRIYLNDKVSVDPDPQANAMHRMTSDKFFENNKKTFDIVFIDGLHHADQVQKDFNNALDCLNPGGCILLHDTNPEYEQYTVVPRQKPTGHWNGDVYRFACKLFDSRHYYYTVNTDNGVTCVFPVDDSHVYGSNTVTWKEFYTLRAKLLQLISIQDFLNK
jgi:SAM-dependent methyltransferase